MITKQLSLIPYLLIIVFSNTACAGTKGQQAMTTDSTCQLTPVKKSQEQIRFILDDISKTYSEVGGGGITGIKLSATNTFVVSISQEERIDQITYELDMDASCKISIVKKELAAVTPWNK